MDSAISFKAPVSPVTTEPLRPVAAPAPAAPTELPAAQTVTPATASLALRHDPALSDSGTTHEVILDPETREIVYRILDANSREVLHQVPDQALLRMHAYTRALENGQSVAEAMVHQDIET
jgi:hypothetical protein